MLSYELAPVHYSKLKEQVVAISNNYGTSAPDILCVSKNHPWEAIEQLRHIGVTQFGENRAQEAKDKFQGKDLTGLDLHFIGHLQRNKVKMVVPLFSWIDSVDSMKLALEIEKVSKQLHKPMNLLFEVKTTNEPSKTGIESQSELNDLLAYCYESPYLIARGLMTIAPFTTDTTKVRASFSQLRELFYIFQGQRNDSHWDTLSMGMSDDYEIAIQEGSTMIRIGTYIFGTRENSN